MKSLIQRLAVAVVAVMAIAMPASAALRFDGETLLSGYVIPGGATSNRTETVSVTRTENVAFQATLQSFQTNANTITFRFHKSIDGTYWDTNQILSWAVTGNGTNLVIQATNIPVLSYGYIRLVSVVNQNPDTGVTVGLKTAQKENR